MCPGTRAVPEEQIQGVGEPVYGVPSYMASDGE